MIFVDPIVNPILPAPKDPEIAIANLISGLVAVILVAATIWSLLQVVIGGFRWISSGGDKAGLEAARDQIIHAIVGLIITFAAWAIFLLVLNFLGFTTIGGVLKIPLPSLNGS